MPRYFLLLLVFLIFRYSAFAQEAIGSFGIKLPFPNFTKSLAIVDSQKNINLLFIDKQEITHVNYNVLHMSSFQKEYPKPPEIFSRLQGFNIEEDDSINLFFSNLRNDGFFLMAVNDGAEKLFARQFMLEFENGERFLETINHDHKFHMLTYVKGTSFLKRYTFNKTGHTVTIYDLNNETFYEENSNKIPLSRLLSKDDVSIIEENLPSSIEVVAKKTKIYPKKGSLLLTLNHRINGTRTIDLSLIDNSYRLNYFEISKEHLGEFEMKKSNSYINDSIIYQLSVSKDKLVFTADHLSFTKPTKVFSFVKDETIPFKNGPIYEEAMVRKSPFSGNDVSNRKEIEDPKEFLRKLSKSDVGLFAIKRDNILDINVGGVREPPPPSPATVSYPVTTTLKGGATITINMPSVAPVFYGFSSYTNKKSVFIKCLINSKTLNHLKIQPTQNAFDKISMRSRYLKNSVLKKRLKVENIFKKDDYFVYGYYDKKEKRYHFFKFEN